MRRFLYGLAAGALTAGAVYAVPPPLQEWWYVAGLAVSFVVWFGQLPDIT